jgi:hypothetical protein
VLGQLKSAIGRDEDYRADIASTVATRIINYSLVLAENAKSVEKSLIDRITKIITEDIFTNDIRYNVVKQIYNGNTNAFKLMTLNQNLIKYIMK